jgi:hypothetical protein
MAADTEDKVSPVGSLVSVVVSVIRLDCEETLVNPLLVVIVDKLFKFVVDVLIFIVCINIFVCKYSVVFVLVIIGVF